MILITVGTARFNFNRLFKIIDELCEEKIIDGKEIIAQIGYTEYKPKHYKSFSLINSDDFNKYIEESKYIIAHAGVGTVVSSVQKNKKVIVFPRMEKYNEHVDDHQLELSKLFKENNYAMIAKNKKELKECILKIDEFKPNKYKSNNKKINELIMDYIERGI